MSFKLHAAITEDANKVRNALGEMDVSSFEVRVVVSGRCLSDADECKITYTVEAGYSNSVKGDSIEACLDELKRRLGWHKKHEPLALAKPRTASKAKANSDNWAYEAGMEPSETN